MNDLEVGSRKLAKAALFLTAPVTLLNPTLPFDVDRKREVIASILIMLSSITLFEFFLHWCVITHSSALWIFFLLFKQ